MLEEFDPTIPEDDDQGSIASDATLFKNVTQTAPKPLQTIMKDMIIEKFNGRSPNLKNWISTFEHECSRVNVPTDRYHEAMRLFLEGSALDWYIAMKLTISSNIWKEWRTLFLDSFANKGWSNVVFAYL